MNASHANITTQSTGLMERTRERKDRSRRSTPPNNKLQICRRSSRFLETAVALPHAAPDRAQAPGSQRLARAEQVGEDAERSRYAGRQLAEPRKRREHVRALAAPRVQRGA